MIGGGRMSLSVQYKRIYVSVYLHIVEAYYTVGHKNYYFVYDYKSGVFGLFLYFLNQEKQE